jgi:hypothetical protein
MLLHDKMLLYIAVAMVMVGLFLLVFAPVAEQQRYMLTGSIVQRTGNIVVVNTNVTLYTKNVTHSSVNLPVFWDGSKFIAAQK